MKMSRFSEAQIVGILEEHRAGLSAAELCRKRGNSNATFYNWRRKYGGMEVADAKRFKALEVENAKLKEMLAEQTVDVATLKEMLGKKKLLRPGSRGKAVEREKPLAAAGLCAGRDRSARVPTPLEEPEGH